MVAARASSEFESTVNKENLNSKMERRIPNALSDQCKSVLISGKVFPHSLVK